MRLHVFFNNQNIFEFTIFIYHPLSVSSRLKSFINLRLLDKGSITNLLKWFSPINLEVVSKPSIRFKVKAGRGIQPQEYI